MKRRRAQAESYDSRLYAGTSERVLRCREREKSESEKFAGASDLSTKREGDGRACRRERHNRKNFAKASKIPGGRQDGPAVWGTRGACRRPGRRRDNDARRRRDWCCAVVAPIGVIVPLVATTARDGAARARRLRSWRRRESGPPQREERPGCEVREWSCARAVRSSWGRRTSERRSDDRPRDTREKQSVPRKACRAALRECSTSPENS